jgi:hypothetical protein
VRSDPGAADAARLGGRSGRRFPAPPGASRQPSEPCQRPGPPFPGRRAAPTERGSWVKWGSWKESVGARLREESSVTLFMARET